MSHTRIKICGLTQPDEAIDTFEAGADAIGFNFYPKSSRFIDLETARSIIEALPILSQTVGLFVDLPYHEICSTASLLDLNVVQTYTEPDTPLHPLKQIAAFRIRDAEGLSAIHAFVQKHRPGAVLIDAHVEGAMGGTGHVVPWELLDGFDPGVPMILAGGLTPENVAEAIRRVRPWGVDVASGVESSPGRKDPEKVRRFIDAARSAL